MNSSIRSMNLHKENSQSQCCCFNIVGEGQGTHQQSTALLFKTTSVELTTTPMIFYFQNKMRHSYNPWRPPWNAQSVFEIIKMKHLTRKCITEYLQKNKMINHENSFHYINLRNCNLKQTHHTQQQLISQNIMKQVIVHTT